MLTIINYSNKHWAFYKSKIIKDLVSKYLVPTGGDNEALALE